MKQVSFLLVCFLSPLIASAFSHVDRAASFEYGDPGIKSMHALAFSPDGVLFIGDSKSATIFAIQTEDVSAGKEVEDIEVNKVDELIADALGTEVENITIQDMAIHPLSKRVYLAVHHVDGTPVLLTIQKGRLDVVNLSSVNYSKAALGSPVEESATDRRGRSLRQWAISDLEYFDGRVLVSGLSNKEFSSSVTMMSYPFKENDQELASLEIWHAAHGQFETHSPIKTFTTAIINSEPQVVASYTCTPLVLFPLSMMKSGAHVKGRTVAELGNRNTPLDIISMEKGGESYLLMANTSRALMKISYQALESFDGSLTEPVTENSGTAGIDFINLPLVNVLQLAKLDDKRFVMLQRRSNGDLDLHTGSADRWL